jgi:c(7)-type cytochrome triheme protein
MKQRDFPANSLVLGVGMASVLATGVATWFTMGDARAQSSTSPAKIYSLRCAPCHDSGLLGAPRAGDVEQWKPRLAAGRDTLVANAIKGIRQMPPRGGNPGLSDADVAAAVDHLLARISPQQKATTPPQAPAPAKAATPRTVTTKRPPARGANAFNRLMKPPSKRNLPPTQDGIHDPASEGTALLQAPRDAFGALPKANSGNRVDWVKALGTAKIDPRYDKDDPAVAPVVMDLNIVRQVKGSMPDVVYPHKQHTEWLDCSNCHPAIFIPQKGANNMSMAGILLGEQCGVCHGKVAFPVSDCRRCHSGKKGGSN